MGGLMGDGTLGVLAPRPGRYRQEGPAVAPKPLIDSTRGGSSDALEGAGGFLAKVFG